jgi:dipeptidyl aminopeptidase/acylaminoacyl peptidase
MRAPAIVVTLFTIALLLPAAPRATATEPAAPAAQEPAFTIEQVMSYAFPSELIAALTGRRIAWLANDQGRRNVWVAEGGSWEPRRLTSYLEDDGQVLSGLAFTPDGDRLIYLYGGDPNRSGELPNPTSEIDGVTTDLWLIDWAGGEPERIAGAVSPVMSPTEATIAWAEDGIAWSLDLDADSSQQLELFRVRSDLSDLQWSPDGTRLAFTSARDGRSILGVFALQQETLRWLTNSADEDLLPRWSPDGTRLAFIRLLAGYQGFSVWTVDTADGEARELWRAPDHEQQGRYPTAIAGEYDLMYGNGFLVFPGEMTGWNHLYAIPEDGGEPRDLTPGDGIVENAKLSADCDWVWVSANTLSIDTRQLERIRLSDGQREGMGGHSFINWNPAPGPDGSWIAHISSTARQPASVFVRQVGSDVVIAPIDLPADFPEYQLVEPRQVVFEAADGMKIHGQLFVPEGLSSGADAPAVIFMHGGSRRQMLLGWHNRGYYHGAYAFNQYLVAKGYVVLSVNFRSGIGYGVEFREPPEYGWRGASDYQDIVAAGHYLQSLSEVDPERIGLWGGSYGGYLTAMGLARNSELFKAGVDLHGVHDWSEQLRWYGRGQIQGPSEAERERTRQLAFRSSPVADIETWTSPVLIIHGDDDRNVPFEASIDLVARLRQKGDVHFEEIYFIDDVHGFLRHENWLTAFRAAGDFFDRFLASRGEGAEGQK